MGIRQTICRKNKCNLTKKAKTKGGLPICTYKKSARILRITIPEAMMEDYDLNQLLPICENAIKKSLSKKSPTTQSELPRKQATTLKRGNSKDEKSTKSSSGNQKPPLSIFKIFETDELSEKTKKKGLYNGRRETSGDK